jgi:hypothetical protein
MSQENVQRAEMAGVFHVRDGTVTRCVGYVDRVRAVEAVGLRE